MKLVFWTSCAIVAYAYVGYAVWLQLLRRRPLRLTGHIAPRVSIVMAVRNGQEHLPAKLQNLHSLDYPAAAIEIIVVSDGSTDSTPEILQSATGVVGLVLSESRGKAVALNAAVHQATGEILVFMDVRQRVDANAVTELVACFEDGAVGAVSGELVLERAAGEGSHNALGIYWKIEKTIRKLESLTGSVVGATGALYAIRRELYVDIPAGTILDDVFVPMNVARQGRRVVFQPTAIARDRIFSHPGKEFSRKVRTLTGNYQLVKLAPWLLSPANPLLFRFISHKLLRLLVPLLLALMLVSSATAAGPVYKTLFVLQLLLYAAAAVGAAFPAAKSAKPVAVANTFVMLNVAAALAFYNFVSGRDEVWT